MLTGNFEILMLHMMLEIIPYRMSTAWIQAGLSNDRALLKQEAVFNLSPNELSLFFWSFEIFDGI